MLRKQTVECGTALETTFFGGIWQNLVHIFRILDRDRPTKEDQQLLNVFVVVMKLGLRIYDLMVEKYINYFFVYSPLYLFDIILRGKSLNLSLKKSNLID